MSVIQIPFETLPTNVSVSRGKSTTPAASTHSPQEAERPIEDVGDPESVTAAVRSLSAMNAQLRLLDQTLKDELASIGAHLVAAASQIAREALGSDNALIEERVTHFAEVLLRQIPHDRSAIFYVHPSCVSYLSDWMSRSEHETMEIQGDATVDPGDCRIESDDKGFLASLDSFLSAAAQRTTITRESA